MEDRVVPYAASGNLWPNPQLVTISFVPDGTNLGGVTSNLFAAFDARFGSTSVWQNVILKAAQVWAQQANVNFTVVGDSGADSGSGDDQQGDPTMGDIRIGGFDFQDGSFLALGFLPPPVNNYSVAGDIGINTGQIFNINSNDYDLFTVMTHEFGHALGLDHSASAAAIMYPIYQGVDSGLFSDDIAGIRSIYGPRQADAFDAVLSNGSFGAASDITPFIDPNTDIAELDGLDITQTGDVDYYKFTVPADSAGTVTIRAQSAGLSLLSLSLRVYNANPSLIGVANGNGSLRSTPTLTLNAMPGDTYYIRVAGGNFSSFGTGAYSLIVNAGSADTPTANSPSTPIANGDSIQGGGGLADRTNSERISVRQLLGGAEVPFVDAFRVSASVDGVPLSSRPSLGSRIGALVDGDEHARSTFAIVANPTSTIVVATPPILATMAVSSPTPSRGIVGIDHAAANRLGVESLGSRANVAVQRVSAAASVASRTPNAPAIVVPLAGPCSTTTSVVAERNEGVGIDARPAALLSLVVFAVGLNPPVSADERRHPFPGN